MQWPLSVLVAACSAACSNTPSPTRLAYDMSNSDGLTFVLGPHGIDADLSRIEAGEKLDEMWTYVHIPSAVLDPRTMKDRLQLNIDGIIIADEFFADDPTAHSATVGDFRIDFVTSSPSTTGSLDFDRNNGGSIYIDVTYKGTSTVYGPPIYVEFEFTTGFPF